MENILYYIFLPLALQDAPAKERETPRMREAGRPAPRPGLERRFRRTDVLGWDGD